MNFAKLVNSFQIFDCNCIVNFELDVAESNSSWDWFNDDVLKEIRSLLTPIIKEIINGAKNTYFDGVYDSSPIESLQSTTFQLTYFIKREPYIISPCLIKCEQKKKYRPVNVSHFKLFASVMKRTYLTLTGEEQTILQNQLKPYFGKLREPVISNYFQKKNVHNQLKTEVIPSREEIEKNPRLNNVHCEQTDDHAKTDLISVCDPILSSQEDLNEKCLMDEDCGFTASESQTTTYSDEFYGNPETTLHESETYLNYEVDPFCPVLYTYTRMADNGENCDDFIVQNFVECELGSENQVVTEYKILRSVADDEDTDDFNIDQEKTSKHFYCNKRSRQTEEVNCRTDINRVLNELEKPDPEIDRLVAAAKSTGNCKGIKLAPIFTSCSSIDCSNIDDSFDLKKVKRCRILGKPSVAKRKEDVKKKVTKKKCIGKNKSITTYLDIKKEPPAKTILDANESESDNSLPPAFDFDEDYQPSRSDVLENLSVLRKLIDKETKVENDCVPIVEEHNVAKEIQSLTTEQLDDLMKKNKDYFKEIFKGTHYCRRHQDYIKGGKTRVNLISHVFLSLYTDSQADFVMDSLMDIFCKKNPKYNDYVFKVLLTEALIKIVMDYKGLSYEEAEKKSFLARFT